MLQNEVVADFLNNQTGDDAMIDLAPLHRIDEANIVWYKVALNLDNL